MHPLQTIMIIGITSFVLVSAMLVVVRKMPSKPGIGWWIGAMLITACSYLLAFIFFGEEKTAIREAVFTTLQLSAHVGLTIGTLTFFTQAFNKKIYFSAFAFTAITVCLLIFNELKLPAELLFVAFLSSSMFYVSFRLFKLPEKNRDTKATIALYAVMGIHWLDYPFLSPIEWFAPIGFLIGIILGMFLGLSLAALALLQFEKQTKESEQKAIFDATHDPLTGLYNRSYLDKLFNMYTKEAKSANRSFLMMYMDLDGFKAINDTYGHKAGDFLLKIVAKRLAQLLQDRGDAVRIGGDELVVLATLRADCCSDNVYGMARRVLDTIEQPIVDGENTYNVSASIGVCCYPLHGEKLAELLERTDTLMYAAKKGGRRQIKFADFIKKTDIPLSNKLQSAPAMADIA